MDGIFESKPAPIQPIIHRYIYPCSIAWQKQHTVSENIFYIK
jgi:hypothetical protein